MISKEYTYMSPQDRKKIFLEHLEKGDKLGKKVDSVTIRIRPFLMRKNLESRSNKDQAGAKKRSDADHGRFVHGIRKAFAT